MHPAGMHRVQNLSIRCILMCECVLLFVWLYITLATVSACVDSPRHRKSSGVRPPLFRHCDGWSALWRGKSLFCPKLWHVQEGLQPIVCACVCARATRCMCVWVHAETKKATNVPPAKTKLIPKCVYVCVRASIPKASSQNVLPNNLVPKCACLERHWVCVHLKETGAKWFLPNSKMLKLIPVCVCQFEWMHAYSIKNRSQNVMLKLN